jgi:glc operon protein GlcG
MDGAYLGSGDIALHKAQTSARFPFPTRGVQDLAYGKDLKGGMVPGLALVTGIVAFAGGLPIMTEGKVHIVGSASAAASLGNNPLLLLKRPPSTRPCLNHIEP